MASSTPSSAAELPSSEARRNRERRAVEAVLASEAFERSKSLCKLLSYICNEYFEGRAKEIKEYNIAVEALGRPADFDPKNDAIVRVEMHRLRKRLTEYYAGPGAHDQVRIVPAEKGYVPDFVFCPAAEPLPGVTSTSASEPDEPTPTLPTVVSLPNPKIRKARNVLTKIWIGLAAAVLLLSIAIFGWLSRPQTTPAARPQPVPAADSATQGAAVPPAIGDVRILAGRNPGRYTDRDGQVWEGDPYFKGGEAIPRRTNIVTRGFDANIFASMREGSFEYAIPLKPGAYEAELFFAESQYGEGNPLGGGETSRLFSSMPYGCGRANPGA